MALHVIEEIQMAELIVQILSLLLCVRKKYYESGIEMKKENRVRSSVGERRKEGKSKRIGSVGEQQKEKKSKRASNLDEIQHFCYRLLNCT